MTDGGMAFKAGDQLYLQLLKNGLSLKNMTYVDRSNDAEGTDGYQYNHADLEGMATGSLNAVTDVLNAQKTEEGRLFEDNIGATIHSLTQEQIDALRESNPARYELINEYLSAEQAELHNRHEVAEANREAERRRQEEEAERRRQEEEAERRRQEEEAERRRQEEEAERQRQAEEAERQRQEEERKTIEKARLEQEKKEAREALIKRRQHFIETGNTEAGEAGEHAERWELAEYKDLIWEQFKDKCDSDNGDAFVEKDDDFYAEIMTLNTAVHNNLSFINTLVQSEAGREITLGLPQLEEKLTSALKAQKKELLTTDADKYKESATALMSEHGFVKEGEYEKWNERYNALRQLLPESCFNIKGGAQLVGTLVLEENDELYQKKVNAIVNRRDEYRGILRSQVEQLIMPIAREQVMADLEKVLDFRMIFSDKRGISAAIRGELDYLVFASPEGVYLQTDFSALMEAYKLPELKEYKEELTNVLMNDQSWKSCKPGKERVAAMKKICAEKAAQLKQEEKNRLEMETDTSREFNEDEVETTGGNYATYQPDGPVEAPVSPVLDEKVIQDFRTHTLSMLTEDVKETDREITYQYKKVEGRERWLLNGKFELTERERRLKYARKVWEILEDKGVAWSVAGNISALYDSSRKEGNDDYVRGAIKVALEEAFKPDAVKVPGYMERGELKPEDIYPELCLMGLDVELLSTNGAGADTFLKYESKDYQEGLRKLSDTYSARYVALENTINLGELNLSPEQKKAYRRRLHKAMCSQSEDEWQGTLAGLMAYEKSKASDTEEGRALADEAEALHKRVNEHIKRIEKFEDGKFAPIIERLKQDPKVWDEIVREQDKEDFDLLLERINKTYGVIMDAAKKSSIPEFILEQYFAENFDNDIRDISSWNANIDRTKTGTKEINEARDGKVKKYADKMATYMQKDFMEFKVEGRKNSIEDNIEAVWKSVFKKGAYTINDKDKDSKMNAMTYVALLFSQKGASFKMLYKEGTLETELKLIQARHSEYKDQLAEAFKTQVASKKAEGEKLFEMTDEALKKMYDKYVFIHAKELPAKKGTYNQQELADKMAAGFYAEIEAQYQEYQKQEKKSAEAIKKEKEFAEHVERKKKNGQKRIQKHFDFGMTPEEIEGLMKSRSVLIAGTQAHLDNDSEELKKHDEELSKIIGKEGMDPFIYTCLLEKYQSIIHSAQNGDSKDYVKDQIIADHKFLSRLKAFAENEGYSKEKQECFTAWFYRHGDQSTLFLGFDTNTDADFLENERFLEKQKLFEQGYNTILSLEESKINDPVIQREQTEYAARMRMAFFATEPKETKKEDGTIDSADTMKDFAKKMDRFQKHVERRKQYLFLEDVMASMYMEVLQANDEVNVGEHTDYGRYMTGLKDYFASDLVKVVLDDEKFKETKEGKGFDLEEFKKEYLKKIKRVVNNSSKRQFLYNTTGTAGSEDVYGVQNAIEGQKTSKDLDKLIRGKEGPWDKDAYNKLSPQERKLFALALTITSQSGNSLYEGTSSLLKSEEERKRIQDTVMDAASKYLEGENIEGFIDYDVAMRKLLKDKTGTSGKDEYNKEVFDEALAFTKLMMEERQKKISEQVVDKKLLSDGYTSLYAANQVKGKSQLTKLGDRELQTIGGLCTALQQEADAQDKTGITETMQRINRLIAENGVWKLIEVLQDRNALDFSSQQLEAEDSSKKVIPHVDDLKRQAVKGLLMDDFNRDAIRKKAENPRHLKKALASVLSFQMRDSVDFSGREITKDDFAKGALERETTFDWDLIRRGLDLLDEITNEQNKRKAIERNFTKYIGNEKSQAAMTDISQYEGKKKDFRIMEFEARLMDFTQEDYTKNSKGVDRAAILAGYFALSDQEKALFFRALEHRDVLDISKVNLYWNIIGRGDRDFVNPEGRNALIDEFIQSTGGAAHMTMKPDTIYNAMSSLLSTQIDDSMSFMDPEKDIIKYAAGEKAYFFKRDTAIDWKLFARALQMVHRAKTEMDLTRGDMELQRGLGNISSAGRMSLDTSFMRTNIHRTGGRLTRFVAAEAGDRVAAALPVDTLQGIAAKVLSTDKMNKINGVLSRLNIEAEEDEEEEEGDQEEQQDQQQDDEQSEEKSFITEMTSLFFTVKEAAGDIDEQLEPLKKEEEVKKTPLQEILEGNGIVLPEEKKFLDTLVEGISSGLETIGGLPDTKGDVDDAVFDEEHQALARKLVGEKVTAYVVDFYSRMSTQFDDKQEQLEGLMEHLVSDVDSLLKWVPKQEKLMAFAQKAGDFWENSGDTVTGYVKDAVSCVVSMKGIYDAAQNMSELDEAAEKALVDRVLDDERIEKEIRKQDDKQKELFDRARAANQGLTSLSNTFAKEREKEDVMTNSGEIAGVAARVAADLITGSDAAGQVVEEIAKQAIKLAVFIHHCIADHKGMEFYYGTTTSGCAQANAIRKGMGRISGLKEGVQKMSNAKLVQTARGFESEEELVNFTGFQMVHSLLFSASDYNPLEETRNVSKVVLGVLGLRDLIGKTDSESAMRVYAQLTR